MIEGAGRSTHPFLIEMSELVCSDIPARVTNPTPSNHVQLRLCMFNKATLIRLHVSGLVPI